MPPRSRATTALKPFAEGLRTAKAQLQEATIWLMQNGLANPDNAGAASTDYLHLFGLTGARPDVGADGQGRAAPSAGGDPFNEAKLKTGRYFLDRILPEAGMHLAKLKTGAAPVMALEAEAF